MSEKQVWQTIALDLKRGANYMMVGRYRQAKFYLDEAKQLFQSLDLGRMQSVKRFIRFEGLPEDILLGSSIISGRI